MANQPISAVLTKQTLFFLGAVVIIVALLFSRSVHYPYTNWDDKNYIQDNDLVARPGGAELSRIWALPTDGTEIKDEQLYIPLTYTSYWLESRLFGLRPAVTHAVNVLLHGLNAVLLCVLLLRLALHPMAVLTGTLLMALHPLQVEPVVWCMGRKDLLATLCVLIVLHMALSAVQGKALLYIPMVLVFALGLLAKPSILLLPLFILIYGYINSHRPRRNLWVAVAAMTACSVFIYIANSWVAVPAPGNAPSLVFRITAIPYLVGHTLFRFVCLTPLSPIYLWPELSTGFWILSLVGLLASIGLVVLVVKRKDYLPPVTLLAVAFAPAIGIVIQYRQFITADRYAYFPMIAIGWGVAMALPETTPGGSRRLRLPLGVLLAALAVVSHVTMQAWSTETLLWQRAARVAPNSSLVQNNLGSALTADQRYTEAAEAYEAALSLEPNNYKAWNNLGELYIQLNRFDDAERCLNKALGLTHRYPTASHNLGVIKFRQKQYDSAIGNFRTALSGERQHPETIFMMGLSFQAKGDHQRARVCYEQALNRAPDNQHYRNALENVDK